MEPVDLQALHVQQEPNVESIAAWATSMFVVELPEHEVLKEDLLAHAYQVRASADCAIASQVAVSAKNNLFESRLNFLESDAQGVSELRSILEELVSAVAEQVNSGCLEEGQGLDATIVESWCHITENGGYHDAHSHPNCSWCGIYYLDAGDCELNSRSGVNRFYDPRNCANQYHDAGTQYLDATGVWDFVPKSGQVVVFPSYLTHSALPYFGEKDRVVIAFNCRVSQSKR
ncbi:2OG-Fe(II) oxygenase family protein [Alkalimarinus alittae]|uniref:2OG-Fe(II) oxygenase family protein n=1 Tax=Alkalimarinus alittae TaxID=2961619 RepID=A0ABY6N2E0_9ALTE|nr:2OG-Fe(II) oxygenase family protein [Alkalimarinus alittae]UZE96278.1 2OG-Fe(II) oxygenase family protein [Alkalimarinus alittae]